jgi:predicted aspartyl protease
VRRSPVPGEAPLLSRVRTMAVVQNVTLGTLTDEIHLDAVIDTGSTLCVVPPIFARQLGFNSSNRLEGGLVRVIGGGTVQMDKHRLERVRVGSAMAYDVEIGVQNTFAGSRQMLVGLTFIKQFRTTFDFDEGRVLFRTRSI